MSNLLQPQKHLEVESFSVGLFNSWHRNSWVPRQVALTERNTGIVIMEKLSKAIVMKQTTQLSSANSLLGTQSYPNKWGHIVSQLTYILISVTSYVDIPACIGYPVLLLTGDGLFEAWTHDGYVVKLFKLENVPWDRSSSNQLTVIFIFHYYHFASKWVDISGGLIQCNLTSKNENRKKTWFDS